jgi:rare lipoprotein A (peptidoglycan hydrolase)
VSPALVQREAALAAVAVLALVVALAVGRAQRSDAGDAGVAGTPAPAAADWYGALAAPYAFEQGAKRTKCGIAIGPRTMGVAHPVLPCGAKIVVEFEGTRVVTQVIDRGPSVPGREFDVSRPLAQELKLQGVQPIRWQFAR